MFPVATTGYLTDSLRTARAASTEEDRAQIAALANRDRARDTLARLLSQLPAWLQSADPQETNHLLQALIQRIFVSGGEIAEIVFK